MQVIAWGWTLLLQIFPAQLVVNNCRYTHISKASRCLNIVWVSVHAFKPYMRATKTWQRNIFLRNLNIKSWLVKTFSFFIKKAPASSIQVWFQQLCPPHHLCCFRDTLFFYLLWDFRHWWSYNVFYMHWVLSRTVYKCLIFCSPIL